MKILDTIKTKINNLPGIRTTNNTLIQRFYDQYGWGMKNSNKPTGDFDLYYQAGNNVYVYRSIQVIIETLLGTGFMINSPEEEFQNVGRKNYLTNLFNNPMGFDNEMTFAMFHTQYTRSFLLVGDAFIEVKENKDFNSVIEGYEFIPPELMQFYPDTSQWGIRGSKIRYEPSQLIHIYEPDVKLKGYKWGMSKIDRIGFAIGLLVSGLEYNQDIFLNEGLDPKAILSFDKDTSYENFNQELSRLNEVKKNPKLRKGGTLAVKGANLQNAGVSNRDMDFLNLMNFARDMIVTAYGVQPSKVGIRETASLGSGTGESQDKDFKDVVNGIARYIEDGFNKSLGRHAFNELFSYNDLDIENKLQRAQIEDIQLKNGTKLVNEVRNGYALDPVKYGDVPMNYSTYGKPNNPLRPTGAVPYAEVNNVESNEIRKSIDNVQKYKSNLYNKENLDELWDW